MGFEIVRAEEVETPMVFTDPAGLVYYLRLVPWAVDGFNPLKDHSAHTRIDDQIATDGHLRIRGSCMLLETRTPVPGRKRRE